MSSLRQIDKEIPLLLNTKIIGHRGAAAYAPENTIASFEKAFQLGCRFIEFDVMLSADGEPFIFHDENLKRTTNGKGMFGLVKAEYLQNLDAGRWFSRAYKNEKIPSFSDTLAWLIEKDVQANIEIKPYPGTVEQTTIAVLTELNKLWPHDKDFPLISSFEYDALTLCRSLSPEALLGFLMHEWDKDWYKKAKDIDCYSIHCNRKILTASRIEEIKSKGFKLLAYTVNRRRQAKKFFALGVDAIFSDYPDLL